MDLKEILNLHQNLLKINWSVKTPWQEYMEVAHSGLWAPDIIADLCRHAGILAEVGPVFFKLQSMSVNLDPRVTKRNDPAGNKVGLPKSLMGSWPSLTTDHRKQFQCLSKVLNNKIGPSFLECS